MRRSFSLYSDRQLWLPLITVVPVARFGPKKAWLPVYFPSEWSEDEILRAHGGLLELSLSALTQTGNADEKADVLNWVFTDWVWDWKYNPEGSQITKTHAKKIPFSFLMCCEASGMDPEVIREYLMQRLKARQTTMH